MRALSVLPGRIRWHVPDLRDRPALADAVARELETQPLVRTASANALTGNLLLTFEPAASLDESQAWVAAALERARATPARRDPRPPMIDPAYGWLLERTRPHRALARRMLGAAFFNRLLDSSPPILIGTGLDILTRGPASVLGKLGFRTVRSQFLALGGIGLATWAVDSVLDYVQRSSSAELANVVRNDLRNELYAHLQQLDVAQIEARDVSSWINLIEDDLSRIHGFIKDGSDPIITIAANSLAVAATFLTLSPSLALLQLLLIPPVVVASKELLGPLTERILAAYRENDHLSALVHGNLSSLATIKSFASQEAEARRVAEAGVAQMASTRAANDLSSAYVPTLTMIVGTGFMGTLLYGGMLVKNGTLAPGAYNIVGASQLRMLAAVGYFGVSLESLQRTTVSLRRVADVLEQQPTIRSPRPAVPFSSLDRDIVLDDVRFGYEADRQVLRGVRLRLPARQTVGIVGSSGAGKTTILKLLLRFYDPQDGAVRYDGVDLRDLRIEDLRSRIAMVAQDLTVFSGTVRDNIAYAHPEASDADVRRAAEIAEAAEFIGELPEGYDTLVGFGGLSLSVGQRQRLAIARVVLADRPIVLFDEATSALDYQTEAALQRSLAEVTAGRTTIIVAHRLAMIRRADLIYVLDDGLVKEQGHHDELVAADGIYASMWRVQTGEPGTRRPPAG